MAKAQRGKKTMDSRMDKVEEVTSENFSRQQFLDKKKADNLVSWLGQTNQILLRRTQHSRLTICTSITRTALLTLTTIDADRVRLSGRRARNGWRRRTRSGGNKSTSSRSRRSKTTTRPTGRSRTTSYPPSNTTTPAPRPRRAEAWRGVGARRDGVVRVWTGSIARARGG